MGEHGRTAAVIFCSLILLGLSPPPDSAEISETFDLGANAQIDSYLDDGNNNAAKNEIKNETVQTAVSYDWGGWAMEEFNGSPYVGISDSMGSATVGGRSLVLAGPAPFDQEASYAYTLFPTAIDCSAAGTTLTVSSKSSVSGGSYVLLLKIGGAWFYRLPVIAVDDAGFSSDDIILSGAGSESNIWVDFTGTSSCMDTLTDGDECALRLTGVTDPAPNLADVQGIGFYQNNGYIAIDFWSMTGNNVPVELSGFTVE